MDEGTIKTPSPKCRLYWRLVYRLKIQPVMLAFSTPVVNCCPSTFYLTSNTPLLPSQSKPTLTVCGWGVGGGVLSCVVDQILQEFNTLFLTRFRTYKIATPPQTKTPVKTTFRDWCFYSFFVHDLSVSSMPVPVFFENICWGFNEYLDVYVLAVLWHTAGNVAVVILHVSACDINIQRH